MDNIFFLLILGIVVSVVFYTIWGLRGKMGARMRRWDTDLSACLPAGTAPSE